MVRHAVTAAFALAVVAVFITACGSSSGSGPGGEIAFNGNSVGPGEDLSVIRADGTHLTRVTRSSSGWIGDVAWRGRTGELAFASVDGSLELVRPGSAPRPIVPEGGPFALSPTGDRVAYFAGAWLWVERVDGRGLRRVARIGFSVGLPPGSVSWSPDGDRLAFIGPNLKLFVVDAAGSQRRQLTPKHRFDQSPAWSPDGRWIAVVTEPNPLTSAAGELTENIAVLRPDGTDRHLITNDRKSNQRFSWSPDAKLLVVTRTHPGTLALVAPEGGKPRTIGRGFGGTFSPDGKYIAFVDGKSLFVVNLDGTGRKRLAATCCYTTPLWSVTR